MRFFELQQLLPTSSSFAGIRRNGQIYVDKTAQLYALTVNNIPRFLSRPRRFGKSTLVSALAELFEHGVKPHDGEESCFKDLAIEKLWHDEGSYRIIKLDFSELIEDCRSVETFADNFSAQIDDYAQAFGVTIPRNKDSISKRLNFLLQSCASNSVVLLVDEYDAPVVKFLDAPAEDFAYSVEILRSFYNVVKRNADRFRCVFITGITRYKDAYLLTQGNTVSDISQSENFAGICGYTRSEIRQYFREHLIYKAACIYNCPEPEVSDPLIERLLDEMEQWYDGYCFAESGNYRVFSPWSVLKFLEDSASGFKNYWFDAAGIPSILRKSLHNLDLSALLQNISAEQTVSLNDFLSPSSLEDMRPQVLLYQCGYLTLSRGYFSDGIQLPEVQLQLPNLEVRQAAARLWCDGSAALKNAACSAVLPQRAEIINTLTAHDGHQLMSLLNRLFETIEYEHSPLKSEAAVSFSVQLFLLLNGIDVICNAHQASGRADAVINCNDTTVVLEYKYARANTDSAYDALLQQGKDQLLSHAYADTLRRKKYLWQVALVFSGSEHRVVRCAQAALHKV